MIDALERAVGRPVSRETLDRLDLYAALLREGNERQNLVAAATLGSLWERHILDSAQLARFEPRPGSSWVDIGSGAGLPGVVLACLIGGPVTLVEPRRLRSEFLQTVILELGLSVTVIGARAQRVAGSFDVITGRAVASLSKFNDLCSQLSTKNTVWVQTQGRHAHSELAEAERTWQGVFHVEQSVTDADSRIIVGTGVRARKR